MGAKHSNIDQLVDVLQPNSIVLTPNQRLSRALSNALTDVYQNRYTAWQSPNVLPLNTWLLALVEEQRIQGEIPLKPFAHPLEELDLWQSIIEADSPTVLRPKALAKTAKSAYKTLLEWQLDIEQYSFDFNAEEDSKHYLAWHRSYKRQLHALPVISQVDAISLLPSVIDTINAHLVLVGFQSIAPLYQSIINKAPEHCQFEWQAKSSNTLVYAARDSYNELQEMAAWAQATTAAEPNASIALCVPKLSQNRATVMAYLDDVFQPQAALPQQQRADGYYDISAGISLAETPIGASLVNCLQSMKRELPLTSWRAMLTSPLLGLETDSRPVLDRLKRFPLPQAQLGTLAIWLGSDTAVEPIYQHAKTLNGRRKLVEWVQEFTTIAKLWGWAAGRSLNSHEYQQHQACLQALAQLGRLQLHQATLSYNKAVEALTELIAGQVFHAQTPATNISVLGSLEAAGQTFDHLWVCGLEDNEWPPTLAPNALIPLHLQQTLAMPRGSTQREFEYAQAMLNGFTKSASNVVLSHLQSVDEVEVSLSRLVDKREDMQPHQALATSTQPPQLPLTPIDDQLISTNKHERTITASVLRDQSQCPFKAFAAKRLGLKAIQQPSEGLNAADRGRLLHRAFEAFFGQHTNSEAIAALQDDELAKSITAAAKLAINDFPVKHKRLYRPALFELEQWRLEALLEEWLNNADSRRAFQVQALEYEYSANFGDTTINMRLDRVDTANQQWFIIDYKSSAPTSHNWRAERLYDPQLPLYAVAMADNKVCGIAVAHIRPNESALIGFGTDTSGIDKPVENDYFEQLLIQWRAQIGNLAEEYVAGVATVTPVNRKVCNVCDYGNLCRIFEAVQPEPSDAS